MLTLNIREETFGGAEAKTHAITLLSENLTLAELIRLKVEQEVEIHNKPVRKALAERSNMLTEKERLLNRDTERQFVNPQIIDPEKEYYRALDFFQKNRLFVLIDGKQVEDLHEPLSMNTRSEVNFIHLMPLVGG